jgi:hypothetical protein
VSDLQRSIREHIDRYFPDANAANRGLALCEEAGELLELTADPHAAAISILVARVARATLKRDNGHLPGDWTERVRHELLDVVFVAFDYADREGFDLLAALSEHVVKVEARRVSERAMPDRPIIVGDPGELERVTALAVRFETALHRISASIAGSVADLQEEAIEALNVKAADHA